MQRRVMQDLPNIVSIHGPSPDRIEEVVLWKKGWKCTTVSSRVRLFVVMLAYCPDPGAPSEPIHGSEGTVDWQANIQAIQNLMGTVSDVHDAIIPLLPLLVPPPQTPQSQPSCATPTPSPTRNPPPPSPVPTQVLDIININTKVRIYTHTSIQTAYHRFSSQTLCIKSIPTCIRTVISYGTCSLMPPTTTSPGPPLHPPPLAGHGRRAPVALTFLRSGRWRCGVHASFCKGTLVERGALKALSDSCVPFSVSIRLPEALLLRPLSYPFAKPIPKSKPQTPTPPPRDKILTVLLTPKRMGYGVPTGEVELWENERWAGESRGGSVAGRRGSMVFREVDAQGRDESSDGGSGEGVLGRRLALELGRRGGRDGWSYTNDTWDRPCADARPGEGWVTRRRRYYIMRISACCGGSLTELIYETFLGGEMLCPDLPIQGNTKWRTRMQTDPWQVAV
ncbi:hypothetical protein BU15DRAFT_61506 [Melanogaster broomeanus]|nr:hypothetical protein BU15DRAFT_61506 [Melanogaster broomeanus]